MQRLKQLGRDSLIYGFGSIAARGVGLIILPVYTRIFSVAEFGTMEMLTLIATLLSSFLVMGLDSAQSFYFFEQKDRGLEARSAVVSAILQWRLIWGTSIVLLATASAPVLNSWLFDGALTWHYFALAFSSALFQAVVGQSVQIFRLLFRPWLFIAITLAQTLLSVVFIITLVLIFDQGILAFFAGSASASLLAACFGWYFAREHIDFRVLQVAWWPRLLRFGMPLVPAGLAMYGMNASGRWFLQYYHGPEQLGLYAVGAKIALVFALFVETFRKAWWPIAMDAMHSHDGPATFRMIARLYMGFGVASIIVLTLISPWLIRLLTGPDFHSSWPIVGVLCWQSLFYGLFLVASAGMFKAEKTHLHFYIMGGSALINAALNVTLVPPYGGLGAALSTALAFLIWICVSIYTSERLWRTDFQFGVFLAQTMIGATVVGWLIFSIDSYSMAVRTAASLTIAFILVFFSLDRKQRSQVFGERFKT